MDLILRCSSPRFVNRVWSKRYKIRSERHDGRTGGFWFVMAVCLPFNIWVIVPKNSNIAKMFVFVLWRSFGAILPFSARRTTVSIHYLVFVLKN